MSAAGRKIKAIGRLLTRAISKRNSLRNCASVLLSRLDAASNYLPSEFGFVRCIAIGLITDSLGQRIEVFLLSL